MSLKAEQNLNEYFWKQLKTDPSNEKIERYPIRFDRRGTI